MFSAFSVYTMLFTKNKQNILVKNWIWYRQKRKKKTREIILLLVEKKKSLSAGWKAKVDSLR